MVPNSESPLQIRQKPGNTRNLNGCNPANAVKSKETLALGNDSRWETTVRPGLHRHEAEGNQRGDDPFYCDLHEPAKEAPASVALFFHLAPNCNSEVVKKGRFCTRLKNSICAGNTK